MSFLDMAFNGTYEFGLVFGVKEKAKSDVTSLTTGQIYI